MRRTAEELAACFMELFPDDKRDEVIEFMEDVTDSVTDAPVVDEKAYVTREEYDKTVNDWKEKYMRRFRGEVKEDYDNGEQTDENDESITIDDLFEDDKEGK